GARGTKRLDRPEVGGRILQDLQPECRRRRAEPLARGLLARPPGHPVPTTGLTSDRRELGEQLPVEIRVDHTISASSLPPVSCTGPSSATRQLFSTPTAPSPLNASFGSTATTWPLSSGWA